MTTVRTGSDFVTDNDDITIPAPSDVANGDIVVWVVGTFATNLENTSWVSAPATWTDGLYDKYFPLIFGTGHFHVWVRQWATGDAASEVFPVADGHIFGEEVYGIALATDTLPTTGVSAATWSQAPTESPMSLPVNSGTTLEWVVAMAHDSDMTLFDAGVTGSGTVARKEAGATPYDALEQYILAAWAVEGAATLSITHTGGSSPEPLNGGNLLTLVLQSYQERVSTAAVGGIPVPLGYARRVQVEELPYQIHTRMLDG